MNRIALISDIHGNLPALEAVLNDIRSKKINRIICLGDLAGKGPCSSEVVDIIKAQCEHVVKGNWDYYMTDDSIESHVIHWHKNKLGNDRIKYLDDLPLYFEFYMSGKLIRLCHASPNDLFHRTHLSSSKEDRYKLFLPTESIEKDADIVGYGDIHSAHIDNFDGKTIFNVGSVGNPLELTQASYAIIEGDYNSKELSSMTISLARVPYDVELAIKHAYDSGMPDIEDYVNELRTAEYRKK